MTSDEIAIHCNTQVHVERKANTGKLKVYRVYPVPHYQCWLGARLPYTYALSLQVNRPLKLVIHDRCDARSSVTFPAVGHRLILTSCCSVRSADCMFWRRCQETIRCGGVSGATCVVTGLHFHNIAYRTARVNLTVILYLAARQCRKNSRVVATLHACSGSLHQFDKTLSDDEWNNVESRICIIYAVSNDFMLASEKLT